MTERSSCRKLRYAFTLILAKNHEHLQSKQHWERTMEWFMNSPEYRELNGIDGEPVEFEWNISQETQYRLLREIQKKMAELNNSEIESSSCRCTTASIGRKMET